jgi:alpha-glucuronidase
VKINDAALNCNYRMVLKQVVFPDTPPTLQAARQELNKGLTGMLNISPNARYVNGYDVSPHKTFILYIRKIG